MRLIYRTAIVFLIFSVLLSIFQFSVPYIIGFDGYINIKAADLIRENGFFNEFPWAQHTILSSNYADIQILFRIILIPFTFLGLELGAKIASILFSALAFAIFYWFLAQNRIQYPFFWTILYMFTAESLMYRFMELRQMPIIVALLMLTIYFLQQKKYFSLGVVSLLYALLHSSFVFQLLAITLYFILEKIFSKRLDYRILLYPFLGTSLGLLINPYFPNNIYLLYTQIFQVNLLGNLYNAEWKPWPFLEFMKNNFLIIIYFIIIGFILVKEKTLSKNKLLYLLMALFFLVYTILSRRMQEYLVPFSILSLSLFLTPYIERSDKEKIFKGVKAGTIVFIILLASLNSFLLVKDIKNNTFLQNFENCADWMKDNIPENSLVFNNAYAFPYLFFKNSDLRYTHGVDLTYSYLYDKEEFERYMGVLRGTIVTDTDWIVEDYAPDYVFSGKIEQDRKLFGFIVRNKENYRAAYEDEWCAVLEVRK